MQFKTRSNHLKPALQVAYAGTLVMSKLSESLVRNCNIQVYCCAVKSNRRTQTGTPRYAYKYA